MASNIFSSTLYTKSGLPHATICGFFICICGQPIDLIRIHLLHCVHGESTLPHMIQFEIFSHLLLRMSCFVSWMNKSCSLGAISLILIVTSGYCVYNKWYSHFSKCDHCWSNSCKSYFVNCFFSGSDCDNCS
jgi:hypothetical protein